MKINANASSHRRKKLIGSIFVGAFLLLLAFIMLLPAVYTIFNSFMGSGEISRYYSYVQGHGGEGVFHLLPDIFTLEGYYNILLRRPEYLIKFWNSILICVLILPVQIIISCMGGFAFSKYSFPFRKTLFFIIIVLMMLPLQVTLVPNFLVLDKLRLLNSRWALILPAAFSPFGTFIMAQVFSSLPNEVLQAAVIDGANTNRVLWRVAVPSAKGGLISMVLLCFIDAWSMVEQPIVFLNDVSSYPLSVFLALSYQSNYTLAFSCGVLAMLPVMLVFLFFNDELIKGIEFTGIK